MRKAQLIGAGIAAACALAGCSVGSGGDAAPTSGGGNSAKAPVTLVTHDSWVAPKKVLKAFTKKTGYPVKVAASGDAGQVANKLVLTKGNPPGDVTFGIDNTFASRVVDAGALAAYSPKLPEGADRYALKDAQAAERLTPIDFGDVCVNVDDAWFTKHGQKPPQTLGDLTEPAYKGLFVTPGAATSSPGMAFLLATIAKYGPSGWQAYWKKLMANGTKITSGWSDAWNVDYTAGGGHGDRPIVLSYNTSPADTVSGGKSTTSALMGTCFQQVEYAGVLEGAKNPEGAKAFIDFLLSKRFQDTMPANMYVFPVNADATLPKAWRRFVDVPKKPLSVPAATIAKKRKAWIQQWRDVTSG